MYFFLFLLTPLFLLSQPQIRHLYLSWHEDPTESVTINVHTFQALKEIDLYVTKSSDESSGQHIHSKGAPFSVGSELRFLHHITLQHLQPGTTYTFALGNKEQGFTTRKFKTVPLDAETYRFVEGGDWEVTPAAEKLAETAASYNPLAVWLGGDYPRGVESRADYRKWDAWLDVYTKQMNTCDGCMIPLVAAIGNNEVVGGFEQTSKRAPFFFHYFRKKITDKSYFSLAIDKKLLLLVLDSGHTQSHKEEQLSWLKKELSDSSHIPIKFALYHVPIYPSIRFKEHTIIYKIIKNGLKYCGYPHLGKKLFCLYSRRGEKYWGPLFDQFNLTAAFEHHDQTLKRTQLLKNGMPHPEGTLYLGDGGWGPESQLPPLQTLFSNKFSKTAGQVNFFWLIDINKQNIEYSAISEKRSVVDHYLQKIEME